MTDLTNKADWSSRRKGDAFVVHFSGLWVNGQPKPDMHLLHADIEAEPELHTLHLEADHLVGWDSSLLIVIRQLCEWAESQGLSTHLEGMPDGVRNLIVLSRAIPENKQTQDTCQDDFLSTIGEKALAAYRGLDG